MRDIAERSAAAFFAVVCVAVICASVIVKTNDHFVPEAFATTIDMVAHR